MIVLAAIKDMALRVATCMTAYGVLLTCNVGASNCMTCRAEKGMRTVEDMLTEDAEKFEREIES